MSQITGFDPYFNNDSKVLILGSFPSVKSRGEGFYYGNKRNAFWGILSNFFSTELPATIEEKKKLLKDNKVALWDVVYRCEITASRDDTIKNYTVADVKSLLCAAPVEYILINGGTALKIFNGAFKGGFSGVEVVALPSTSPANTKREDEKWYDALRRAFSRT